MLTIKTGDTNQADSFEPLKGVGGAAAFIEGVIGQARNRYLSACATTDVPATNSCTWASPGVKSVTVTAPATASLTSVMVAFDAPSDAAAAAWLTAATVTSTSTDLAVSRLLPGTTRTFYFSSPITRVDFRAVGAATPLYIEAA